MRAAARLLVLVVTFTALPDSATATGVEDALSPATCDFPDPFVLRDGDSYVAFATGARGRNIQVARSRDLRSWSPIAEALPQLPAWAAREKGFTWAPAVLRRGDRYVLYYTAADTGSGFQCISRALSTRPEGPYVDTSAAPFVCQSDGLCGSIDPSPFVDRAGAPWLLWKSDENSSACRTRARIWSQRLAEDGLSVLGEAGPLLALDAAWEGPLIEGPSMVQEGDSTLLFYSANWYEGSSYAVGYARCAGAAGPCRKMTSTAPLLGSSGDAAGPGGQEPFFDADGDLWLAYHAWSPRRTTYAAGGVRSLRLARLSLAKGAPALAP